MHKKANISLLVFVFLVLITCMTALFLFSTNTTPLNVLSSDVETMVSLREAKDSALLNLKIRLDNLVIRDYDLAMIESAKADYLLLSGVPSSTLNSFDKINVYFIEQILSELKKQTSPLNLIIGTDEAYVGVGFVKQDFKINSGVELEFQETVEKGIFLDEKKISNRTSLAWNYSAPLLYSISFEELGLDSYQQIYEVLRVHCLPATVAKDSLGACLSENLPRWKFDENSISVEKILDVNTNQEIEFFKVNFTSKKTYPQFDSPKNIVFTLYSKKYI